MPAERVEARTINAESAVVNNYYCPQGGQQARAGSPKAPAASPKSRTVALVLCLLLGCFGAHRFYAGRYGLGILFLLSFGVFGFGWLVDIAFVAMGRMRDGDGLVVSEW